MMAEVAVTHSIAMVTSLTQIYILLPWLHYRLTYNTQQLFCIFFFPLLMRDLIFFTRYICLIHLSFVDDLTQCVIYFLIVYDQTERLNLMSVNNTRKLPDVKSKNLKIYLKNTLDKIIFSLGLEMYKYLQIPKNLIKSILKKWSGLQA